MKQICAWVVCLLVVGAAPCGFAEFYKYIDEEGKVQFTDNLANVPDDQRERLEAYQEVSRPETDPPPEAAEGAENAESLAVQGTGEEEAVALEQRGAALEEEYKALMAERETLDEAAQVRLTPAKKRELVEKISDFNLRIKAYEKKRQAYNAEVEAYNARVVGSEPALSSSSDRSPQE